ncbi:sulfite exporter TauE/SafE family protein [Tomitella cavernea]|uniref:Probable membrane transporter protein n=1 Tax=Tomitella cavernea TaxID=1387982 RepID=A0ABP9C072_9ACTN|nr:sulfite exporter TauE/SafE family protein [Tomitella cavernea]
MTGLLVAGLAILIGAVLQRLSGTGVGLVCAPVLTVILGPVSGILVTNATTTVSAFLIMLAVRRDIEWCRYLRLAPGVLVGAAVGALLVRATPAGWLQVLIGAMVLIALATTFGMPRMPVLTARALTPAAGALGGLCNTAAGVSAPVVVVYAKLTGWGQRAFAATMQPTFLTMGLASVGMKIGFGAAPLGELPPWWVFPLIAGIVVVGIRLGALLSTRVSADGARRVAIGLAGIGGAAALARGLAAL